MNEARPLRVLVADDEPLGCERLQSLLNQHEGVEVVGIAEDGPSAIEAIRNLHPDLVFLDIEMPGCSGLEVVRTIGADAMPATILVTAYDHYAPEGFELAAMDYLVKPYSDERFEEALRRGRRRVALESLARLRGQLHVLLDEPGGAPPARSDPEYLTRLAISMHGRVRIVPVCDIDFIEASGPYAEVRAGGERYLVRHSLQSLEEQLDPADFLRIHRSVIVRLDRVQMLLREGGGHYEVVLHDGTRLRVGRTRREELEQRLGRIE